MDKTRKTIIEQVVQQQLSRFIMQNRLTKGSNRTINPISLMKKIKLANEFILKCKTMDLKLRTKEEIGLFDSECMKAYQTIMNYYL